MGLKFISWGNRVIQSGGGAMRRHGAMAGLVGLVGVLTGAGPAAAIQGWAEDLAVRESVQAARTTLRVTIRTMDIQRIRALARDGMASVTDDGIQAEYGRWYRDTKARFPDLHAKYVRRYQLGARLSREKLLAIVNQATRDQCLELLDDLPDELIEENLRDGIPALISFLTQSTEGGSKASPMNRPGGR